MAVDQIGLIGLLMPLALLALVILAAAWFNRGDYSSSSDYGFPSSPSPRLAGHVHSWVELGFTDDHGQPAMYCSVCRKGP